VAFSPYHTDNRCLLDALSQLGGEARGVACIDPHTVSDEELQELHKAGVRGVRLNLRTRSEAFDSGAVKATAARVRHLDWVLQLYIALDQVVELAPLVPDLGVTVVIDHIGAPHADRGPVKLQSGYSEFMYLLRSGRVWTKLSGLYRFTGLPDIDEYVIDILQTAPDYVVWASDWPHSGGAQANPGGDRDRLQEYREVDDKAWVAQCWEWCRKVAGGNGEELANKIWIRNPRILWRSDPSV
jgi:predicted TIM-barrel fold metal-dependent hydrolase